MIATKSLSVSSTSARIALILGFALLTGASSLMKIPLLFSPVPITLQTLVVMLAAVTLGKDGVWSQLVYLLGGVLASFGFASGLPGIVPVVGPTGGYLLGFVGCAFLISTFVRPHWNELSYAKRVCALLLCSVAVFVPGMIQLSLVTGMSLSKAFMLGVLPFLPGDVLKSLLVAKSSSRMFV